MAIFFWNQVVIGNSLHPIPCGLTYCLKSNKGNVNNAINSFYQNKLSLSYCAPRLDIKMTTVTLVPNVGCTLDRKSYQLEKELKTPWEYLKLYVVKPQELEGSRGDEDPGNSRTV